MRIEFEGKSYDYEPTRDLGVGEMRTIKGWYPEIGRYTPFLAACSEGDPDALACLLWLLRSKAGEHPREPQRGLSFNVGELWNAYVAGAIAAREGDDDEDPTAGDDTPEQTSDSTPTPTSSEPSTSDTSPTTSASRPAKSTATASAAG